MYEDQKDGNFVMIGLYTYSKAMKLMNKMKSGELMTDYEESYKNYLAWLTPRELLQEYKIMRFPWRYRERKWIKEEIEVGVYINVRLYLWAGSELY